MTKPVSPNAENDLLDFDLAACQYVDPHILSSYNNNSAERLIYTENNMS